MADMLYILNAASESDARELRGKCADPNFSALLSQQTGHKLDIRPNFDILVDITLLVNADHSPDLEQSKVEFKLSIERDWDIIIQGTYIIMYGETTIFESFRQKTQCFKFCTNVLFYKIASERT